MRPKRKNSCVLLLVIAAVIILVFQMKNIIGFFYPIKYKSLVLKYSLQYNLDPSLVSAVINVESHYKPYAESHKEAKGLMQIIPSTGEWAAGKLNIKDFNEDMLYNPEINIRIGCWYLNYLRQEFGGLNENNAIILAAYNGGSSNVKKWLKDERFSRDGMTLHEIPFNETEKYVERVLKHYKVYKWLYDNPY